MTTVATFYRFAPVAAPDALAARLRVAAGGLTGTVLVAGEGVNGTVAGAPAALAAFRAALEREPGMAALPWTEAQADAAPFARLRVRLRAEIVTLGVPGVDARATGTMVDPADWDALIAAPDVVTIDTRNAYEVRLGTFAGAVDPGTASFRDFPAWWAAQAPALAGKRVAMFCTGGIRCEKASAWLRAQGVEAFQLRGGILRYLAEVPQGGAWRGGCFVFDGRVAVGPGLAQAPAVLCPACRGPLTEADRAHPGYRPGEACPHCAADRSDRQRARYRARAVQVARAAARGHRHLTAAPHG